MATRAKKKNQRNRLKEVDRILKTNLKAGTILKEDVYFARKFLNVVLEADEELPSIGDPSGMRDALPMPKSNEAGPDDFTADQNEVDFEASLDIGTDKDAFDVDGGDQDAESFSNVYVNKCRDWVKKIQEFADFLNAIEGTSLNKELSNADRDGSVFKGITRKVGDNIAKTAGELSRLAQTLSKVVTDAPKKQRELQKLTKIS
jgi:hypothetical protein